MGRAARIGLNPLGPGSWAWVKAQASAACCHCALHLRTWRELPQAHPTLTLANPHVPAQKPEGLKSLGAQDAVALAVKVVGSTLLSTAAKL